MFPTDAETIFIELNGIGTTQILPIGTYTILGISIQQSGVASNSLVTCNGIVIAKNYAKDLSFNRVNYVCNNSVSVSKTGQDNASYIVTYVPYDMNLLATSTVSNISGFTYGEVLIVLLLLMMFTVSFFRELKQWLFGVRIENPIKNKYNKDL